MNILDLLGNDTISQYAEKFGLDQEQIGNLVSNALPMLKEGADVNSIAEKLSESTGISMDTINPILEQFAPKIQELMNGGGLSDIIGNFLGGDNKEGGLGDLLGGFLGKK